MNSQPASFYLNASNLNSGVINNSLLSSFVPLTNLNNTFTKTNTFASDLVVNNEAYVNGVLTVNGLQFNTNNNNYVA